MAGHRAHGRPLDEIAAKQTPAPGRKSGALRCAWFLADDQHGFAKVTSVYKTVKSYFSTARSHWIFTNAVACGRDAPRVSCPDEAYDPARQTTLSDGEVLADAKTSPR
jgi:hypothetical protein